MLMAIGFAPQTFAALPNSSDLHAADDTTDITSFGWMNYDHCNDYGMVYGWVKSSTDTIPDEVIAQVNENNYTMTIGIFTPDGMPNPKDIRQGFFYTKYLGSLESGSYNITIHARKGTQIFSSGMTPSILNKSLTLEDLPTNNEYVRLDHRKYLFTLDLLGSEYRCIQSVIITINGTNYTMIRDKEFGSAMQTLLTEGLWNDLSGDFFFIHEFPKIDFYQEVEYNFTVVYADGSLFLTGHIIKLYADEEFSTLLVNDEVTYNSDFITVVLEPRYYDGLNRPLQGLILNLNGTNITLSTEPDSAEFMDTPVNSFKKPIYSHRTSLRLGEWIKPFTVDLEYGKYYNISFWYSNGTWIELPFLSEWTINKPLTVDPPNIEYQNLEAKTNGTHYWVSGIIKVTSYWPGFGISPNYIPFSLTTGETSTIDEALAQDPMDNDYSNGKSFEFNTTLWITPRFYWGNVLLKLSFFYGNATIGYGYEFNKAQDSINIERTPKPETKYGTYTTPTKSLIYNVYIKEKTCCGNMIIKNQTEIYDYVAFEKIFDGDRIIYNKTYIFDSKVLNRINQNITFINKSKQLHLDGGWMYYLGDPIISTSVLATIADDINGFPVSTVEKAKVSKDTITSLTTISYETKDGELSLKLKLVYDEKGVLRLSSLQRYLGEALIYESVLELEMSLMDTIMEDYLMVIIIGGVALIGVIAVITITIKKRKA